MNSDVRRKAYILIGLILCFTAVFMFKIEERANMHYELKNDDKIEEKNDNNKKRKNIEKKKEKNKDKNNESKQNDFGIEDFNDDEEMNVNSSFSIFDYEKNSDWNLRLINTKNVLAPDEEVILEEVDGHKLDYRVVKEYRQMVDDAAKDGVSLIMLSGQRTYEYQKNLYNNEVKKWLDKGYSPADALATAANVVAIPGTSEHQMGLAIDFGTRGYMMLEEGFDQTKAFEWLDKNAQKYGFIMRYAKDKTELTGIKYEPWHYRYVGREVATLLKENKICLEELFNEPVNS